HKGKVRRYFNQRVAFQRLDAEDADERRIGERADELVVRRLRHRHDFAFDDGADVAGQVRGHAARKAFVNNLQRAQLILRKLVRPPEVVSLHRAPAKHAPRRKLHHHCTTKSVNQTWMTRPCTRMSLTDATISARSFSCPSAPVTEVTVCWRITLRIRSTICGSRCSTSRRVLSESSSSTTPVRM